ncbi:MAG: SIMPL domain-containing protein [Chloroflexi bacterium]|nr:SIMPL domain-containing protein [Chloroflexota bacterium]
MSTTLTIERPGRTAWIAAGLLAGALGASLLGPAITPARAQDTSRENPHTLSVSGTGSVSVKPDLASVVVGVTVQRDKAGAAANDAANDMDAVVTAIKALGIAEDDIRTTDISLDAVYDYDRRPYRLVGYQARNMVAVTVRDIGQTGAVIDAATGAGATDVGSVTFRVADQDAAETAAREAAVRAARAKADTMVAAAGIEIVGIISMSETSAPIPYPVYYGREAMGVAADQAATPVMPGTIDVEVTVSIVYEIP